MKHKLLYIAAIVLLITGCREKGDVYFDPNDPQTMAYTTYADQFEVIWRSMNMYYMFWSEDKTNWDDVYYTMMPKFKALDAAYEADGTVADSLTLTTYYQEVTHSLIDHHLAMVIKDVHTDSQYVFTPGKDEVLSREYTIGQTYDREHMQEAIASYEASKMLDAGQWGKMDDNINYFGIRTLDDGRKIAYLWQSGYQMVSALATTEPKNDEERMYINNIQAWLDMCLTETHLAGIILDNRCNRGGQAADLNVVVAPFIKERLHYADVRYKEGPGRYDYTDWIPVYVEPLPGMFRDIEAEDIPYIVLTNAFSVSMGEVSSEVIKHLPTGRMIGERTFGAEGRLYDYNTLYYNGTFGSRDAKHYVYTSSMQSRFVEEGQVEGIGITPTKVVYQAEDGYLGAMNKAIDYIKGY